MITQSVYTMLILLCVTKHLSTSRDGAKTNERTRIEKLICLMSRFIYLVWSQAIGSFSTPRWIRLRRRAVAFITGLGGSVNHSTARAREVRSSSAPTSLILGVYLAAVPASTQTRRGMEIPLGLVGMGMLRKALKLQSCPSKISTTGNSHQSLTRQNSC